MRIVKRPARAVFGGVFLDFFGAVGELYFILLRQILRHLIIIMIPSALNIISALLHAVRDLDAHSFSQRQLLQLILKLIFIPYNIQIVGKFV